MLFISPTIYNVTMLLPEFTLLNATMLLLLYGVFISTSTTQNQEGDRYPTVFESSGWIALIILALTFIVVYYDNVKGLCWNGIFIQNDFTQALKLAVIGIAMLAILSSIHYLKKIRVDLFEYFVLILLVTLGMMLVISANDFILFYLAVEILSLLLYILTCFKKDNAFSVEAGLKYFILGSFASGILLYGISLVAGFSGLFNFSELEMFLSSLDGIAEVPLMGISTGVFLIITALLFKLTVAPFHMWAPDVYEGASIPVGFLMATAPKLAVFSFMVRLLVGPFHALIGMWQPVLLAAALFSIFIGTFNALRQIKIKRFFAYSSISHMGYILLGVALGTPQSIEASFTYFSIYIILTMSAWMSLLILNSSYEHNINYLTDFAFLQKANPIFATYLTITIFSMCGIPPLAGFFAKLAILKVLVQDSLIFIAFFIVVINVISSFYYLRIIKIMFADRPKLNSSSAEISYDFVPTHFTLILFIMFNVLSIFFVPYLTFWIQSLLL